MKKVVVSDTTLKFDGQDGKVLSFREKLSVAKNLEKDIPDSRFLITTS